MSLKDIAEKTGVSVATVSRVLNDPNHRCATPGLRDEILKTARQLHYTPCEAARNLQSGAYGSSQIHYIHILVTRTESAEIDPFFQELIRLLEGEIHRNLCILSQIWYCPMFSKEENQRKDALEKKAAQFWQSNQTKPDGLIIIGKCSKTGLKVLKTYFKNIVSVNRNSTEYEVDEVLCDGEKIAASAVDYLISLGHRAIGYVGNCRHEARYQGFRKVLFQYHLEENPDYVVEANAGEEAGFAAMEKLAKLDDPPTGIYFAHDILALGALKYLRQHKSPYYIPSIISSDDIEQAAYAEPMLTTVRLPKEDMAKFALYLLLDRIDGGHKATTRVELESSLIIRSSCSNAEQAFGCEYMI